MFDRQCMFEGSLNFSGIDTTDLSNRLRDPSQSRPDILNDAFNNARLAEQIGGVLALTGDQTAAINEYCENVCIIYIILYICVSFNFNPSIQHCMCQE